MVRFGRPLFGTLMVAALIAGPVVFGFQRQAQMRNFRVVDEGVLYRSGQMHLEGLKRAVHDYGIKTVISLRDSPDNVAPAPDMNEETYCLKEEINFNRFS